MTSNHKLTALLKGRTLVGTRNADGALAITFDDGSVMTVQTAPSAVNRSANGGQVAKVRQGGTDLVLDLEGGATYAITTAEETSSVIVRDKDNTLQYAD